MRVLLAIALVAITACSSRSGSDDVDLGDSFGDWKADLSTRNSSGVTGTVGVQSAVAASGVRISIRGATAGAEHPWHVHTGICGGDGGIVGERSAYPALKVGPGGEASALATIGLGLDENARYSVNVHQSATQMNVIIACGDLKN